METNTIKLRTLCTCVSALIVVELAVAALGLNGRFNQLYLLGAARVLEVVMIAGTVYLLEHGLSCIGLEKFTLLKGLKRGLLWSAGFGGAALLLYFVMSLLGMSLMRFIRSSLPTEGLAGFLLVGAVIGPIAEELFFRGVVFGYFRRWGVMAAVVVSTVLFALAHSAVGGVGAPQIIGGIVFAVAYELEGSLMVPVTIHVLGNSAIFALSIG
jgi:membrane protease YdiL (CAAX protease family)